MTEPNQDPIPASKDRQAVTHRRRKHVAEARAVAQRAKLDAKTQARASSQAHEQASPHPSKGKSQRLPAPQRSQLSIAHAIEDYLRDHEGGNHSAKTLEWHRTALGLMQNYLQEERTIMQVGDVAASDLSAWFVAMRTTPGARGKIRSERTIQTYARSARAFFHWLVRRESIERNPFDRVVFPKVGKPLIQTIEPEEFEQLLLACVPLPFAT